MAEGAWQRSGQFCYFDYPIRGLAGATLGIIGDGALGQAVADIGRAFGMRVLFSSYKGVAGMGPLYTPFEDVLRTSDVITLHCPLTPATRNMIAAPEFAQMARAPLIVNTARGGLVDEQALAEALERGQIAGAAFDVVTTEPPPADHPFMRLVGAPGLHPDAARRVGEPRGDPGSRGPARREHRALPPRHAAAHGDVGAARAAPLRSSASSASPDS